MKPRKYTDEHIAFIRKNINLNNNVLVDLMNAEFNLSVTYRQLIELIYVRGLSGLRTRFKYQSEHDEFLLANKELGLTELTRRFNHTFALKKSKGAIVARVQSLLDGQLVRRIRVGTRTIPLCRFVWECAYGPLPEGLGVVFIDGDHQNYALSNLKAVPLAAIRSAHGKLSSKGGLRQYSEGRRLQACLIAISCVEQRIKQHEAPL